MTDTQAVLIYEPSQKVVVAHFNVSQDEADKWLEVVGNVVLIRTIYIASNHEARRKLEELLAYGYIQLDAD